MFSQSKMVKVSKAIQGFLEGKPFLNPIGQV